MLRAVGDIILVEEIEPEQKQGAIIVTLKDDSPFKAKVLSVGDTVKINVKAGDIVLVSIYARSSKLMNHGCFYANSGFIIAVEE